ncbi:MAG: hypothetical protein M1812_001995 [Candelaria pacifica]|nr:MAG: hypothetical protein M1812_001995 [Candelaria pacifica]
MVTLLFSLFVIAFLQFIRLFHRYLNTGIGLGKNTMISEKIYNWCNQEADVSSELAKDPNHSSGKIVRRLYGNHAGGQELEDLTYKIPQALPEDLQRAFECGRWGNAQPSELFLQVFHDVLCTLEHDPMAGMTSPSLLGSYGTMPMTIISALPDICRHMSNLIARAESEVFLATNYWKGSDAALLITNSLKELSRRAGERGRRAVVKIMYDRGNPKQVINNHQCVSPATYTGAAVQLPSPEEIPNIDMEVVNYHRPIFGTFHAKFMVVDRKIGILSSNNIQDNDNMEMMTEIEGPIVDSLYDMALITWHNAMEPPSPSLRSSPPTSDGGGPEQSSQKNTVLDHYDYGGGSSYQATMDGSDSKSPAVDHNDMSTSAHIATSDDSALEGQSQGTDRDLGQQQNSTLGSLDLPQHTSKDPHYDPDNSSELARMESFLTPKGSESHMSSVTRLLNTTLQPNYKGTAPECAPEDAMTPMIIHKPHNPFPIALVNRKPWGAPNHASVHVPQNEAWLSAMRNAKKSVFIQSPNLNAEPLLPQIISCVRRGIDVYYYVCLGYNDMGELLPYQGGTNEMIAHKLYQELDHNERKQLHVYFYVGKDQIRPIHNKFKHRSCHIKLMIVDEHIGIQGSGNQDTQSWYHSQEVNIMIDSFEICKAWVEGIRRNQNTHLYGAVDTKDGVWRDLETGEEAEGSIGINPGKFSWAKGIVGAVNRVRGVGGF